MREQVAVKLLNKDGETDVLALSAGRRDKEQAMRQRRLKRLWRRLKALQGQDLRRDPLLLKLGAAQQAAGRADGLVKVHLPEPDQGVRPDTFTFALERTKLRQVRRREGRSLLRSNLPGENPAQLWRWYIQLTELPWTTSPPSTWATCTYPPPTGAP